MNLASRLEGITKEYGADIIVGEGTRNAVSDVMFRELDRVRVRVKGKDVAVTIFEPVGLEGEVDGATLAEIHMFDKLLRFYRSQDWDMAERILRDLRTISPESKLYKTFFERLAFLRLHPPGAVWDGAINIESK